MVALAEQNLFENADASFFCVNEPRREGGQIFELGYSKFRADSPRKGGLHSLSLIAEYEQGIGPL